MSATAKVRQQKLVIDRLSKENDELKRELWFWLPLNVNANSGTVMAERVMRAGHMCGDYDDSEPDAEQLGWISPGPRRIQAKTTTRKKSKMMGLHTTRDGDRVVIFAQDGWGQWIGAYDDGQTGLWRSDGTSLTDRPDSGEDLIL